jgi:hypothetical protein
MRYRRAYSLLFVHWQRMTSIALLPLAWEFWYFDKARAKWRYCASSLFARFSLP